MSKQLLMVIAFRRSAAWLAAAALVLPGLWLLITWLNRTYRYGLGWMLLTLVVLVSGVLIHLYQRRRQRGPSCSLKARLGALQVSCLAAMALGVQILQQAGSPDFAAALPFLAWTGWPYVCIIAGLAGLGWLSFYCDCRNQAILRE